jgi:hypothetical protein
MSRSARQEKSSRRNFGPAVPANSNFVFGFERLSKVVVGLHAKPSMRGTAEGFRESDCHFRADAGAMVDEIVQRLP